MNPEKKEDEIAAFLMGLDRFIHQAAEEIARQRGDADVEAEDYETALDFVLKKIRADLASGKLPAHLIVPVEEFARGLGERRDGLGSSPPALL